MKPKILILPGNGNTDIVNDNWYDWLRHSLKMRGFEVIAENMPDPVIAHMNVWVPYIEKMTKGEQNWILIGHSSGAIAIQKYLENHKALGAILVGTYYTDLGLSDEKESGYFDEPWQWDKIRQNSNWIVQFAGVDDPYISQAESRFVQSHLNCEYHEYTDLGHFGSENRPHTIFPEIITTIERKLKS